MELELRVRPPPRPRTDVRRHHQNRNGITSGSPCEPPRRVRSADRFRVVRWVNGLRNCWNNSGLPFGTNPLLKSSGTLRQWHPGLVPRPTSSPPGGRTRLTRPASVRHPGGMKDKGKNSLTRDFKSLATIARPPGEAPACAPTLQTLHTRSGAGRSSRRSERRGP